MNATREEKKKEAVERLKLLKVYPETIRQFEEEDLVSQTIGALGACYWLDEDQLQRVKAFEEKSGGLVYHVIPVTFREIGKTETYLYVCDSPEEWEMDREDLEAGQAFCYVANLTYPDFSEFGSVGIALSAGAGLVRTC